MSAGLIDRIRSLLEALLPAARAAKIDNADVATSTRATPADVENRATAALNTALPPAPTVDSLFERIKTLDDNLTAARIAFIDAATSSRASPADVDAKLTAWLNAAIAANPVANSVWERIKTLDDNYTATRAGFLDIINTALDVTVGSRAPAATALSNATWTNARAALVDRLDVLLSSRATPADVTAARDAVISAVDAVGSLRAQVFTASGTWVRPANVTGVRVVVVGGGGGSGGVAAAGNSIGGGGGGGAVVVRDAQVSGNVVVTVGAGGAAGAVGGNGGNGGNTSFGSLVAYGGIGGGYGSGSTYGAGGRGGGNGSMGHYAGPGGTVSPGGHGSTWAFGQGGGGGGGGVNFNGGSGVSQGGAGAGSAPGGGGSYGEGADAGSAGAANTGAGAGGVVGNGIVGRAGGSGLCIVLWNE
jgi:hypothetical protein